MKYHNAETDRKSPSTQMDQSIASDSKRQDVIETNLIPESDITATTTTLQETKQNIKSRPLFVITKNLPENCLKRQTTQEVYYM